LYFACLTVSSYTNGANLDACKKKVF
jgi:hypothetical protein